MAIVRHHCQYQIIVTRSDLAKNSFEGSVTNRFVFLTPKLLNYLLYIVFFVYLLWMVETSPSPYGDKGNTLLRCCGNVPRFKKFQAKIRERSYKIHFSSIPQFSCVNSYVIIGCHKSSSHKSMLLWIFPDHSMRLSMSLEKHNVSCNEMQILK